MGAGRKHDAPSISLKTSYLFALIVVGTLASYVAGLTSLSYAFSLVMCLFWIRTVTKPEAFVIVALFLLWGLISYLNFFQMGNYIDLTIKGSIKLLLFALSAIAFRNYFIFFMKNGVGVLRVVMWSSLIISLVVNEGYDVRSMQQMMVVNVLFIVELLAFMRGESRIFFYIALFLLIITTKKQLWFSALVMLLFVKPDMIKKYIAIFTAGLLFVAVFGVIGAKDYEITAEKRVDSFLTERFITPDPYGNMRLYLVFRLVPELLDTNPFSGYGLERFGSVSAYETDRDIESSELGLGDFIGAEYNPNSLFDSVSADVGALTILMQMGVLGLLFYFLLMVILTKNQPVLMKGIIIIMPYFLGGPVVWSIGFPILSGSVYALLIVLTQEALGRDRCRIPHMSGALVKVTAR